MYLLSPRKDGPVYEKIEDLKWYMRKIKAEVISGDQNDSRVASLSRSQTQYNPNYGSKTASDTTYFVSFVLR